MSNPRTFIDLFTVLQKFPTDKDHFYKWMKEKEGWKGKDKQESLFRLFAGLDTIDKLKGFTKCIGNFNKMTIKPLRIFHQLFYDNNDKPIFLKDKGDSCDLVLMDNTNPNNLLLCTSKNLTRLFVGNSGVHEILTYFAQYEKFGYTKNICCCVKNATVFKKTIDRADLSSKELVRHFEKCIIIDWDDLYQALLTFLRIYGNVSFDKLVNYVKKSHSFLLHQLMAINKILYLKNNNVLDILLGSIQRSGKTYIMCGSVIKDSQPLSNYNALIITTAPNETFNSIKKAFDCQELKEFKIRLLNGLNKKQAPLTGKNVIICSKQFLQTKLDSNTDIPWLRKMSFNIRFVDESHNGGTTRIAQNILDYYGKNTPTVYVTATYSKPVFKFDIPLENCILWDLEDVKLCQNIDNPESKNRLIKKHPDIEQLLEHYTDEKIKQDYSKYPSFHILTQRVSKNVAEIINENNTIEGWSVEACFTLVQSVSNKKVVKKSVFQNPNAVLDIFYKIFGKYKNTKLKLTDPEYPVENVFMKRIEKLCKAHNSTFIDEQTEPTVIMLFLPKNDIKLISKAIINLVGQEKYENEEFGSKNYNIIELNSEETKEPTRVLEEAQARAKNEGKKGVIVLTWTQCSLGVTIENCDIVVLLNSTKSCDLINQMMFRCMTVRDGKKCGFVVDFDTQRTYELCADFATKINPTLNLNEALEYLLNTRLLTLNGDDWEPIFGFPESNLKKQIDFIHATHSKNTTHIVQKLLNKIIHKKVNLTKAEQELFRRIKIFSEKHKYSQKNYDPENITEKGIEKTHVSRESDNSDNSDTEQEEYTPDKKETFMDILCHIIPWFCFYTIHNDTIDLYDMYLLIMNKKPLLSIVLNQLEMWWGQKNVNIDFIKKFFIVYKREMSKDLEINKVVKDIKQKFIESKGDYKVLSSLIDQYLIPTKLEKKGNAEISTPRHLRQQMLDKIPADFWTQPKTVFEPCSGKGGFLIDIIDRFMIGLKSKIPNKSLRYKKIVEECLYWSDINPANIYIGKMLLDPDDKYDLKFNEGDTLKLDIKAKWGLSGFDAVIGNPPYNLTENSRHTLWNFFIEKAIDILVKNGYLLYVHPALWRKPVSEKSQLNGLFKKMTGDNTIIYLEIHNTKDGLKTFKCGTRYDWYLLIKSNNNKLSEILDEQGKVNHLNLKVKKWLPNGDYKLLEKITNKKEKVEVIYSRSAYGNDKKWTSRKRDNLYKYPLILSTPKSGVRYMYSSHQDNGHFNIKKVIFGETGTTQAFYDKKGEYGLTDGAIAIKVYDDFTGENLLKCLKSDKFGQFLKLCSWSNYRIEWNMFTDFNKDFWKEFI